MAYAWAYAMAAESIAGITPSNRALWLRALLLERERVANHLGDLGYLGNDCGFAFVRDRSLQAWLADPDGNRIELHQYRPESKQSPSLR